jgi:hypothetical protein
VRVELCSRKLLSLAKRSPWGTNTLAHSDGKWTTKKNGFHDKNKNVILKQILDEERKEKKCENNWGSILKTSYKILTITIWAVRLYQNKHTRLFKLKFYNKGLYALNYCKKIVISYVNYSPGLVFTNLHPKILRSFLKLGCFKCKRSN